MPTAPTPKPLVALFGNNNPQMQVEGQSVPAEHLNQSVTRVEFWPGIDNIENVEHSLSTNNDRVLSMIARGLGDAHRKFAIAVAEAEQLLGIHAAGDAPAYINSEDPDLAAALSKHFDVPILDPQALLTSVGRDALHAQHLGSAGSPTQPAQFGYMAVSANATAASTASTTLPGEITTAGGGLLRALATYAHTAGTNTTTLTKTFTANGSDALPVTLAKIGILNASSVGTLGYETLLSATATLTVSGDNVTITWTDTAG
jgi:hypothetical protein